MTSRKKILGLIAGTAVGAATIPAHAATVFAITDFTGTCGTTLTCVGSTAEAGSALRITPAAPSQSGAGYSTTAIALGAGATFSTTFQFRITDSGGIAPADGFTFVLSKATAGLGGLGGGLGYAGVPDSVAIEFDTFDNAEPGGSNHVAVAMNGVLSNAASANPYGQVFCHFDSAGAFDHQRAGCMSNGDIWTVFINYDGALLDVTVQDGAAAPVAVISDFAIDISALLGTTTAFVGFTSGTGSGFGNHDILNWQLANDSSIAPPPGGVPEPWGIALVGLGLLGAAASRRRSC